MKKPPPYNCIKCGVLLTPQNWLQDRSHFTCRGCTNKRLFASKHRRGVNRKYRQCSPYHCSKCDVELTDDNWPIHYKKAKRMACRLCGSKLSFELSLRERYGLTKKQFDEKLHEQDYLCALCDKPFDTQRPCVDHNHLTGKIRGLIHLGCNTKVGYYESIIVNPEFLSKIKEYLNQYE